MKHYLVYGSLGGSFGGLSGGSANIQVVYGTEENAMEVAWQLAIEAYQSYEGLYGLMDELECEEEGVDYDDEIESWADYGIIKEVDENYTEDDYWNEVY